MPAAPPPLPPNRSFSTRDAARREPHLLHFGLRQMLLFVAGVSGLLALLAATEGSWPWVIGVTSLLIGAHVFGTLIGTRLRDTSSEVRDWRSAANGATDDPIRTHQSIDRLRESLPAPTLLADKQRTPLLDFASAGAGAAVGFAAGLALILSTIGRDASWFGILVGAASCAVLCGWFTWLAVGFGAMARHAWRQANAADNAARSQRSKRT